MHEIERNYEPRNWERCEEPPRLSMAPSMYNTTGCNSDSAAAKNLMEHGHVPFLVDYELLAAGEDPISGCFFKNGRAGEGFYMCVYARDERGQLEFHWYKEVV